jgi:hypothetical protein
MEGDAHGLFESTASHLPRQTGESRGKFVSGITGNMIKI